MAMYTPGILSESSYGEPISVAATSSPGTLVHSFQRRFALCDIWVWLTNLDTSDVTATIEWGASSPAITVDLPAGAGPIAVAVGNRVASREVLLTGLFSINFGSTVVTGNASAIMTSELSSGDKVVFGGTSTTLYEVDSVSSDTIMDLVDSYPGTSLANSTMSRIDPVEIRVFTTAGAGLVLAMGQIVTTDL